MILSFGSWEASVRGTERHQQDEEGAILRGGSVLNAKTVRNKASLQTRVLRQKKRVVERYTP
jgi:hypothetical protein